MQLLQRRVKDDVQFARINEDVLAVADAVKAPRFAGAMDSATHYREKLAGTRVTLEVIDGLDHAQELEMIDRMFPREIEFTRAYARP